MPEVPCRALLPLLPPLRVWQWMAVVLAGSENPRGSRMAVRGSKPDTPIGAAFRPMPLGSWLAVLGSKRVLGVRLGEHAAEGIWQFLLSNIPTLTTRPAAIPGILTRAMLSRSNVLRTSAPPFKHTAAQSPGPNLFPGNVAPKQQRPWRILQIFFGARVCVRVLPVAAPGISFERGASGCPILTENRIHPARLPNAMEHP